MITKMSTHTKMSIGSMSIMKINEEVMLVYLFNMSNSDGTSCRASGSQGHIIVQQRS